MSKKSETTTPGDARIDAVASPVDAEPTRQDQMSPPDPGFQPAARPEGACANCGEPSTYRTTSKGAEVLEFCDAHRPEEGVEELPRQPEGG